MRKVVVTGGAGFVGSHLAEELARQGNHVIILDDLSTGKIENIKTLIKKSNVQFIQDSITNFPLIRELFRDVALVFHLAAISSVPRSGKEPLTTNEVNISGTLNVLLAARDNEVRKVVYASSCAVYGDTPTLPKREDMALNPLSVYATTKIAGEYYCQVFQEVYELPTICLRYFNVYGPGHDPNSTYAAVIPKFIKNVLEERPLIIFGDGKQTRDFIFIKDVVAANIQAAESNASGIFNIGKGESISINQLAKLIIRLVGSGVKPVHKEPSPGDIRHSLADIAAARAFGYEPKYTLEEGLRETISSFQSEI